jgi:oligosaccharide 4-alpha-D-glucosyltransferase
MHTAKSIFFWIAFLSNLSFAQNQQREFIGLDITKEGAEIKVSDGLYLISPLSEKIIQTTFLPTSSVGSGNQKINEHDTSHAVLLKPSKDLKWELDRVLQEAGSDFGPTSMYILKCGMLEMQIFTNPFHINYTYLSVGVSEARGYYFDQIPKIEFKLESDEKLMGAGARALGMNRRGYRLQLYNRAHYGYETHSELMNFTMPIVLSDKGYAIHFDNPQIGWLDLDSKKENKLTYEVIGGPLRYQVIFSDDWKDLSYHLTSLLGRQPMPARWTLGNFSSRFGYHSEQEARMVVDEFRKEQIPLDAIVFDLYWFGKDIQGTLGNFEFYRDSFPNGEQMISDFREQNVKTILITEPFVLTTSKNWQVADKQKLLGTDTTGNSYRYDFYFGNTGLIDLYNLEARAWFWEIYKKLHGYGAAGFWGDLGEPEVHPSGLKHGDHWADEVHNIYGHDWARLLFEGYRKDYPLERPFILMRAGYSGSQRFGMVPWSGDVNRTWGGLKPQMEISMQMGLQGMAYMHSDLGGFAGANDDPELYIRWLQYGVFQPIFRPHAQQEVASEAIYKDTQTKALAKAAIELRYQLLPYNYSLANENARFGTPLMRPIFMEFPKQEWSFAEAETYMWGPSFLVHAVTDSMNADQSNSFRIKVPSATSWFDFHTGKMANALFYNNSPTGYQVVECTKSLDHIPVFVRNGAIIPMSPIVQSTEEYVDTNVTLHLYIDPNSTDVTNGFNWYEDDGDTFDAQNIGKYKELHCSSNISKGTCQFLASPFYAEQWKDHTFKFYCVVHTPMPPSQIRIMGKKQKFEFNEATQVLTLIGNPKFRIEEDALEIEFKW